MSYILDALNKSEQQRERQQPPRLTSFHHKREPVKSRAWRWIVVLIVLALLNSLFLWYWMRTSTPEPQTPPVLRESVTPSVAAPEPAIRDTYEGELITPESIDKMPSPRPVNAVNVAELPANVQRQIPDLSFSSHIYSEDPSLRMVSINGRNIREGDVIAEDLEVVEITEEGVILRYMHYTFEMSVIRDWSFD